MKTQPAKTRSGNGTSPHPLWMRILTVLCMALLGVASTAQVCHAHDEPYSLSSPNHASIQSAEPADAPPNSPVNCPLCVAMHSALPVAHHLTQVALLVVEPSAAFLVKLPRRLLWRSDLTSRPPPAASSLA